MAQCPTVNELIDKVKSLTRQTDGTFQTAWADSFPDKSHCREEGGYIYIDWNPAQNPLTRAYIVRAPKGATMNQQTTGPNASIDLNSPGIAQNNVILVANFHTHPLHPDVGGDPQPSRSDRTNAFARGLPGIVISRPGVYGYGPDRRTNLNNPKGYPPVGIDMPGGYLDKDLRPVKVQPPPWTVPNQWGGRRGANVTVREALAEEVEMVAGEVGADVIVVEWSSEGVQYYGEVEDKED